MGSWYFHNIARLAEQNMKAKVRKGKRIDTTDRRQSWYIGSGLRWSTCCEQLTLDNLHDHIRWNKIQCLSSYYFVREVCRGFSWQTQRLWSDYSVRRGSDQSQRTVLRWNEVSWGGMGWLEDNEVEWFSKLVEFLSFVLTESLLAGYDDLAQKDVVVERTTANSSQTHDVTAQLHKLLYVTNLHTTHHHCQHPPNISKLSSRKCYIRLSVITSANSFKLSHSKGTSLYIRHIATSPELYCYTNLWNLKIQNNWVTAELLPEEN